MQKSLRGNEKEELAKLKAQGRTHHTKGTVQGKTQRHAGASFIWRTWLEGRINLCEVKDMQID